MKVLGVVVNYNGGVDLLRAVASLRRQGECLTDLLVVDNASRDDSLAALAAAHPDVAVRPLEVNRGFAAGANVGLREACARGMDAVLLVNDDLELAEGCLGRLVGALEADPRLAAAGPKVLYDPERDRIWSAGGEVAWRENLNRLRGQGAPAAAYATPAAVDYLPACAVLLRVSALRRVGLFAEEYFAYMEDVELCWRLKQAGFRLQYVPEALAYHRVARTSGDRYGRLRKYLLARNGVLFLKRHGTPAAWLGWFACEVLLWPLVLLRETLRGRGGAVLAKGWGLWRGLRGETGPPPERLWPQRQGAKRLRPHSSDDGT